MIFAFETFEARYARERDWHRAFAWLPVRLMSGEVAWLQMVNRRATSTSEVDYAWRDSRVVMVYEYRITG